MRVVFAATPALALPVLDALLRMPGADVAGVVSQPDRKSGRGMRLRPSPVRQAALEAGIDVMTPASLKNNTEALDWLHEKRPDVLVVVAFGMLLPKAWLDAPAHGAVNIHASLLPRWRGAAPIERAILAGDRETGVCIMRMDEGLDTGGIYACRRIPIGPETTAGELRTRLMQAGAGLLTEVLPRIVSGTLPCRPQAEQGVSYAAKLTASDRVIDWSQSALQVGRVVRAFAPVPGARTQLGGCWLKVLAGKPLDVSSRGRPGALCPEDGRMIVCCGEGCYDILRLQPEGRKPMAAADFLCGLRNADGLILGA